MDRANRPEQRRMSPWAVAAVKAQVRAERAEKRVGEDSSTADEVEPVTPEEAAEVLTRLEVPRR